MAKAKTNRKTMSTAAYRENRDIDLRGQCIQVAVHLRKPADGADDLIRAADKLAAFVIDNKVPPPNPQVPQDNVVNLKGGI
jgi:hypothetical protein